MLHKKSLCRVGFPKPPSPQIIISKQSDNDANREELMKASHSVLSHIYKIMKHEGELPMEELLRKANFSIDEYISHLKFACNEKRFILEKLYI